MPANASKYAALDRTDPAVPEPVGIPTQKRPTRLAGTPKPVGRPVTGVAKSRDPNMKQYSIILNMDAHADANHLLRKARNEGDLSDLLNRLLASWIAERKAAVS